MTRNVTQTSNICCNVREPEPTATRREVKRFVCVLFVRAARSVCVSINLILIKYTWYLFQCRLLTYLAFMTLCIIEGQIISCGVYLVIVNFLASVIPMFGRSQVGLNLLNKPISRMFIGVIFFSLWVCAVGGSTKMCCQFHIYPWIAELCFSYYCALLWCARWSYSFFNFTLPHYLQYADVPEGIEILKYLSETFCRMCPYPEPVVFQWQSSSGNPVCLELRPQCTLEYDWRNNFGSQYASSVLPVVFQRLSSGLLVCSNYAN